MSWWHENYVYRRRLRVRTPPEHVSALHPVVARITPKSDKEDPLVLVKNGKIRDDYEDVEVVYLNDSGEFMQIYREVEVDDEIRIIFQLQEDMEAGTSNIDRYYIHYGNLDLVSAPARPGPLGGSFIDLWPVKVPHDHTMVTYTRPGEHWQDGRSSHRLARASIRFWGTQIRFISEVGPDQGIAEVRIDESPWEPVDLFSQSVGAAPIHNVFGLSSEDPHVLSVRVSGRRNESSSGTGINIRSFEYQQSIIVEDVEEQFGDILLWAPSVGGV